jgi:DNA-binding MarR family transcriptional regulator
MDDDVTDFGMRIPYLIRQVNHALSQRLDRALKPYSLTQAQLSALAILGHQHPAPSSGAELSQRSGVTPPSMSAALADLAGRGLVRRTPHPTHGRIVEVGITSAGRKLLREVQVATKAAEERDMGGLDAAQQEQLRDLLRTMMRNLDLYLPREEK